MTRLDSLIELGKMIDAEHLPRIKADIAKWNKIYAAEQAGLIEDLPKSKIIRDKLYGRIMDKLDRYLLANGM